MLILRGKNKYLTIYDFSSLAYEPTREKNPFGGGPGEPLQKVDPTHEHGKQHFVQVTQAL